MLFLKYIFNVYCMTCSYANVSPLVYWACGCFCRCEKPLQIKLKTSLDKWCQCVCHGVCDFYHSIWMHWSQAGLSQSCSAMLPHLTCTLTCKDVTRGNHRYLQVCMRVRVFTGQPRWQVQRCCASHRWRG